MEAQTKMLCLRASAEDLQRIEAIRKMVRKKSGLDVKISDAAIMRIALKSLVDTQRL